MTSYGDLVDRLESLVKTPLYLMVGITSDRIVYYTSSEGVFRLWSSGLSGEDAKPISGGRITGVYRSMPWERYVFYTRDVTKGAEVSQIYAYDFKEELEFEALDMRHTRVVGLAHHGDKIVYTGSGENGISLYIGDVGGRSEEILVKPTLMFVNGFDGRYIVGSGRFHGNPTSMELFRYDLKNDEFNVFTPEEGSMNSASSIMDGKTLVRSDYGGRDWIYYLDVESFNKEGFEPTKNPGVESVLDVGNPIWLSTGEPAYTVMTKDGVAAVVGEEVISKDGDTIYPGEKYRGSLYVTYTSFKTPTSIFRFENGEFIKIHGADSSEALGGLEFSIEHTWVKSSDGLEIPVWILENKEIDKPGPTIIYVHGGPWSSVMNSWSVLILGLLISGFHVVAPNFRGSTGYGTKFMKMDIGDPGGMDMEDVAAATRYAVEIGLASNKAIMGYSYGGFMTFLSTVKKPDLWDAGVAGAGIVDWEMMYRMSDPFFKYFIDMLFMGNRDLMRERSAINFVERLEKPLCIIHSQNDSRTPLKPVLKYMERLLEHGKSFEAHIIPDLGHGVEKTEDLFKILFPAILFLNRVFGKK